LDTSPFSVKSGRNPSRQSNLDSALLPSRFSFSPSRCKLWFYIAPPFFPTLSPTILANSSSSISSDLPSRNSPNSFSPPPYLSVTFFELQISTSYKRAFFHLLIGVLIPLMTPTAMTSLRLNFPELVPANYRATRLLQRFFVPA